MGYTTKVSGQFTITPPLSWREIKDSPFASPRWDASDLVLRVEATAVDTEDGQLVRKSASALVMREISEYNCRNLMAQVQKAVDDFPGHEWSGRLDCEGEENADLWRVVIRDGKAVRVEPRIIWPDEQPEDVLLAAWKREAELLLDITRQARLIISDEPNAEKAVDELRELLNP
ncbi:DUF6205 family protein [Kitasatospora mediocidica]|uniref:DUF6205 family protein n=1 Tax=Kitasatospora mediocidica TaxID=58352 RepID=UPI00055FF7DB|nr:DUF6205 family protein [Kitasatospora mediocidica]